MVAGLDAVLQKNAETVKSTEEGGYDCSEGKLKVFLAVQERVS